MEVAKAARFKQPSKENFEALDEAKSLLTSKTSKLRAEHHLTVEMKEIRAKLLKVVRKAHRSVNNFKSKFDIILQPEFKMDEHMVKKTAGGLSKKWKTIGSYMAHGRANRELRYKMEREAKAYVPISEACGTMLCSDCPTLHHPGISL